MTRAAREVLLPTELSRAFRLDEVGLVAGDAICSNVRACQRILALKMTFDGVENDLKALV